MTRGKHNKHNIYQWYDCQYNRGKHYYRIICVQNVYRNIYMKHMRVKTLQGGSEKLHRNIRFMREISNTVKKEENYCKDKSNHIEPFHNGGSFLRMEFINL